MPDLTAHDLYELVKGLPEEARPEGCYTIGDPPMGWFVSWMADPIPVHLAILLHEASVMRWLAEHGDSPELVAADIANWWTVRIQKYGKPHNWTRKHYFGISPLHALVAAAEGVG